MQSFVISEFATSVYTNYVRPNCAILIYMKLQVHVHVDNAIVMIILKQELGNKNNR